MRKNETSPPGSSFSPTRATCIVYVFGMLIVAIPLFYLTVQITSEETLTVYECKLYAAALEYVIAGLTLLTGGCYLVERACRQKQKKE